MSYTTYTDGWNTANYNQGTFYTYYIHGNVDTLLHDYGCGTCGITGVHNVMNQNGNRFKKIAYNYDLISGKVNAVAYQKGWSDQFFHKYSYDGENRLTLVETSLDGFTWERDAKYEYYVHGPLSRTVLGTQQVQGLDYAYTLQGWLKGINSAGATDSFDIGGDGRVSASNRYVARDAFGFALNYYEGDYKPVGAGVNPFPGYSAYLNTEFRPLYNGNISSMVSTNRVFGNTVAYPDSATMLFNYKYDQLNRITGMDVYNKFNRHTNSYSTLIKLEKFKERVSYDANGNILQYLRNGDGSTGHLRMDSLQYHYYAGTNRLRNVRDSVPANWYGANATDKIVDIDHQTDTDNYIYDSIGNLIQDKAEQITNINWNVYGKITGISRGAGIQVPASEISYTYDASGNRISKTVVKNGNRSVTWYVRDAQGNVMATYSGDAPAATALSGFALQESERYIYGSSRLGVVTHAQGVDNGNAGPAEVVDTGGVFVRGERVYELSNHLGNVLVTVSDRKKGIADPITSSLISHFEPIMLSGTDYYPFGMAMRIGGDSSYRYGFNGQERSNEVKGEGNSYTAEFWEYDPRSGRRWNMDPVYKHSPYEAFSGNPILLSDPHGLDTININRHTTRFIPKGKEIKGWDKTSFSINVVPGGDKDVYLFNSSTTTLENGNSSTVSSSPIILNPEDINSTHGITQGKYLIFDGLITPTRNHKDYETIGVFMNVDKDFKRYMESRNPKAKDWAYYTAGSEVMEKLLPVLVQGGFSAWAGFRFAGLSGASNVRNGVNLSAGNVLFNKLETEAAKDLGFFPTDVTITNGIADIPIIYMTKASSSKLTTVENALKANGAMGMRVNSGPIINPTITERLDKAVSSGKGFLGLKVTKTTDANNMFILEKTF